MDPFEPPAEYIKSNINNSKGRPIAYTFRGLQPPVSAERWGTLRELNHYKCLCLSISITINLQI